MTTAVATTAKRSWAQIVKGKSEGETSQQRMKPGARGSLLCPCRGEVLAMLTNYGWIMVYGNVDHPSMEKHEGHVYVNKEDVADDNVLIAGDIVNFYLYLDDKGLGAEECRVEQRESSCFNPDATEFVPTIAKALDESGGNAMRADANEFVPQFAFTSAPVAETVASEAMPLDPDPSVPYREVFSRLASIFADYEDDEDEIDSTMGLHGRSEEEEEEEAGSSGDESDNSSLYAWGSKMHSHVEAPMLGKEWKTGGLAIFRAPSPDGSTSAGATSDSDGESSCASIPVRTKAFPPPLQAGFNLPPGMRLPPNFRPPPGLSLASPLEVGTPFVACS